MRTTDALRRAFRTELVVEIAQSLIRVPTENPPGNESAIVPTLRRWLDLIGARDVTVLTPEQGRTSLLATCGNPGDKRLIWNGHIDVVPAGDRQTWRNAPFEALVSEGNVWGRGAADMKGPIASALAALATIRDAGISLHGELTIQLVADEETGGELGTKFLHDRGLLAPADGAICGEPTGLSAVTAAKGLQWLTITVHGQSAHASRPSDGVNAISQLATVLQALGKLGFEDLTHPLLGQPTLAPTMVLGGTKANVVPDRTVLTLDCRLLPGQRRSDIPDRVRKVLRSLDESDGIEATLSELAFWEPSEVDPSALIVTAARAATENILGRRPEIAGMTGSTDARFLIQAGVPTLLFGPGQLREAHTANESIAIEDLKEGALAYAATFCEFLGASDQS